MFFVPLNEPCIIKCPAKRHVRNFFIAATNIALLTVATFGVAVAATLGVKVGLASSMGNLLRLALSL